MKPDICIYHSPCADGFAAGLFNIIVCDPIEAGAEP